MWSSWGGKKSFLSSEVQIDVDIPKTEPFSSENSIEIFCRVVARLWDLGCELELWNLSLFISYNSGISVFRAVPVAQPVHSEPCWHGPRGFWTGSSTGGIMDCLETASKVKNHVTDPAFRIKYLTVCYRSCSDGNFKLQILSQLLLHQDHFIHLGSLSELVGKLSQRFFTSLLIQECCA